MAVSFIGDDMSFWRDEFSADEIQLVLEKVRPHRIFDEDGRVTLTGMGELEAWEAFLVSAVGIDIRTDTLRHQIIRGALFSTDLKQDFSEKDFRNVTYQLRNKLQYQDVKTYKVAFPIWNKPKFIQGLRRLDDVTINFTPSKKTKFFKKVMREREDQLSSREFEFHFTKERISDLGRCDIIVAHVKANNYKDANERASEAVYTVLGLVNLARDGRKYWRQSYRVRGALPVSEVLIGPQTTTHLENGTLTHNGFWHEDWAGGPNQSAPKAEVRRAWEARYDQLDKGVARSPWRLQCQTAVARYFKAFANPNLEEAFLDGWRLFENVTGSRHEKIADQITRASNVFENHIEKRIIGKHLALRRNLFSHGHEIKSDDGEVLAYQMLQYVVPYMELFILNGFSFKSPKEFWEFLDLPPSRNERDKERDALNRRLSLLDHAAHFRGERS